MLSNTDLDKNKNEDECIVHATCYLICYKRIEKRTSVVYSDYNEHTNGWCIFICNNSISLVVGKCKFWEGISFVNGPSVSLNKWHHVRWIINTKMKQLSIELDYVKVHIGEFNCTLDVSSCISPCYVTSDSGVCIRNVEINGDRPVIASGQIKERIFCVHNQSKHAYFDKINKCITNNSEIFSERITLYEHIMNMYTNVENEDEYKLILLFKSIIDVHQISAHTDLQEFNTEEKKKLVCLIDKFVLTHICKDDFNELYFQNILKSII